MPLPVLVCVVRVKAASRNRFVRPEAGFRNQKLLLVLLPGLDETVVHWITVVDGVFMLISFVSYILAYYGKSKKVQDL